MSPYCVEGIQWNLPQIFIVWVGIAQKFSRWEVIGQRSYIYSCASAIMADAYISTMWSRDSLFVCVFFVLKAALSACEILVVWRSGSTLVSISEVNLHRARLVLRWVTMSRFNTRCRTLILVCNQPPRPAQPSWVGKWVPASTGKTEADMVHSISGWMQGVQVKLRFLENACHTWMP